MKGEDPTLRHCPDDWEVLPIDVAWIVGTVELLMAHVADAAMIAAALCTITAVVGRMAADCNGSEWGPASGG